MKNTSNIQVNNLFDTQVSNAKQGFTFIRKNKTNPEQTNTNSSVNTNTTENKK